MTEKAEIFANKNGFSVSDKITDGLNVVFGTEGVSLQGFGMSYLCDFRTIYRRVTKGRLYHEMLVRAAKTQIKSPKAIDATAGMGEDAFLLAAYGYEVTLCEQNPIIAELLNDGICRAGKIPELKEIADRMSLVRCDSVRYMSDCGKKADIVYLDPMFPSRQKTGLVNKKLQLIQKLESPCSEESELFSAALSMSPSKIIVKRPLKAHNLADREPSYTLFGKAIRYDCYVFNI